ncbi:MAG: hypothetical protein JXR84_27140 [Anaerolineae bacterium]|nr:hypothetical protein [Anaerolineae bacterium]
MHTTSCDDVRRIHQCVLLALNRTAKSALSPPAVDGISTQLYPLMLTRRRILTGMVMC